MRMRGLTRFMIRDVARVLLDPLWRMAYCKRYSKGGFDDNLGILGATLF